MFFLAEIVRDTDDSEGHDIVNFDQSLPTRHEVRKYMTSVTVIKNLQRIQVECLTVLVTFVVTVDWLRSEAKWQPLLGGNDDVLSGKKHVVARLAIHAFSQKERHHSRLATAVILSRNAINQPRQQTRQLRSLNAQPESTVNNLSTVRTAWYYYITNSW